MAFNKRERFGGNSEVFSEDSAYLLHSFLEFLPWNACLVSGSNDTLRLGDSAQREPSHIWVSRLVVLEAEFRVIQSFAWLRPHKDLNPVIAQEPNLNVRPFERARRGGRLFNACRQAAWTLFL
jgi:hypothetical protein